MIECREHPRFPVDLPVFFSANGNTNIREGLLYDISAGGCAVTSAAPMNPGTDVKLLIRATDLGSPITVHSASVRWANHGEFGVEFVNLTELDRSRLHRYLHLASLTASERSNPGHPQALSADPLW
jgi:c-di-GMP-binding flagellar brake protein YcgR